MTFKLGMMIPNTVRQNIEDVATLILTKKSVCPIYNMLNFDIYTYIVYTKYLFNACQNCCIDFKLLGIIPLAVTYLLKTKQLYNHYQKVSMSILSITIDVFFDLLIQVCQNYLIDFILTMMIPNTVRYNVESVSTR